MDDPQPPLTRAEVRALRDSRLREPILPALETEPHPVVVATTIGYAALVALAAFAGPALLALAVAWGGLVLAWGWPRLLGSSSRVGSSMSIATAAVLSAGAVALTGEEPYLRLVPAAVALSLLVMFLHQLLRRDGRPRLTESVAVTAAGIAVTVLGVTCVPLAHTYAGAEALAAALAGTAAGSLADLLAPWARGRAAMVPAAAALGGLAGVLTALLTGNPAWSAGLLLGVLCAVIAQALRRVLGTLPPVSTRSGQVTAGTASVLVTGSVAYVLVRLLVG